MSRTNSQFLEQNRNTGKPDVGSRPNIQDQINVLHDRVHRLEDKLRALARGFRRQQMTPESLTEYQGVNEKLRAASIERAELIYIRNML